MEEFDVKKLEKTTLNGGEKYKDGQGFSAKDLNSIIGGILHNNENGGGAGGSVETDKTLSISGACADAKVTGDEIAKIRKSFFLNGIDKYESTAGTVFNDTLSINEKIYNVVDNSKAILKKISGRTVTYGSEQVSTEITKIRTKFGNLIRYPYYTPSKTQYGVTFTNNGDGSITVSGRKEDNAGSPAFAIAYNYKIPKGNYFLSGLGRQGGKTSVYLKLQVYNIDGKFLRTYYDYGNGTEVVINENEKIYLYITFHSSYTEAFETFTVSPKLINKDAVELFEDEIVLPEKVTLGDNEELFVVKNAENDLYTMKIVSGGQNERILSETLTVDDVSFTRKNGAIFELLGSPYNYYARPDVYFEVTAEGEAKRLHKHELLLNWHLDNGSMEGDPLNLTVYNYSSKPITSQNELSENMIYERLLTNKLVQIVWHIIEIARNKKEDVPDSISFVLGPNHYDEPNPSCIAGDNAFTICSPEYFEQHYSEERYSLGTIIGDIITEIKE